jgi:hypothetical protein
MLSLLCPLREKYEKGEKEKRLNVKDKRKKENRKES